MKQDYKQRKNTFSYLVKLKFNHCAKYINQQIFDTEDYKIASIEYFKDLESQPKTKRELELQLKKMSFNKKDLFTVTSIFNKGFEFEPAFLKYKNKNYNVKAVKENNLLFATKYKKGVVVRRRVYDGKLEDDELLQKHIPYKTQLLVDKNNMKVRLVGYRASPEWVNIGHFSQYNNGNKIVRKTVTKK